MKTTSLIQKYMFALSSLYSNATEKIETLSFKFGFKDERNEDGEESAENLLKGFRDAYATAGQDKKLLSVLDTYCGFALLESHELQKDFAGVCLNITPVGFEEWLAARWNRRTTTVERRVHLVDDEFNLHLHSKGSALWGEYSGQNFLEKAKLLRTTYIQNLASKQRETLRHLYEFCAYVFYVAYLQPVSGVNSADMDLPVDYDQELFIQWLRVRKHLRGRAIQNILSVITQADEYLGGVGVYSRLFGRVSLRAVEYAIGFLQSSRDKEVKEIMPSRMKRGFLNTYLEFLKECAGNPDLCAELTAENAKEFAFGGERCPIAPIYSDKLFRKDFEAWLVTRAQLASSGSAHTFIGELTAFSRHAQIPQDTLFKCGSVQNLREALKTLSDIRWNEYLLEKDNAYTAFNHLKEYLHTHRPLDLDDPEIGGKVHRLLRNSFGGSIEESHHAFSRFQNSWRADFGEDCPLENEQIRDFVKHMCAFDNRDKKYRLPEIAISHELLQKVGTYIEDKYLKRGKPFVQLGAIAAQFNRMYPQEPAFQTTGNESAAQFLYELLQKALPSDFKFSYRCQGGRYYVSSSAPDGTPFPDDVGTYLDRVIGQYVYEMTERTGEPVPQEDLMREFDFVSPDRLETVLRNGTPSLVKLPHGRFLHYSSFALQGELLQTFRDRLVDELRNHPGGIANEELLAFAQQYAPELLQNPATPEALRSLMKNPAIFYRVFKTNWLDDSDLEFAKKNKVTLKGRKTKTHLEDCEDFVKSHRSFTLEELSNIRAGVGVSNYVLQSIRRFSVRLDEQNFVARDAVEFPVQELDAVLGKLMSGRETLRFSELNDFSGFPQVPGFRWTPFLLHHFLCEVSEQYIFVSSAERIKTPQGLIVRRASSIATFPKALAAYLETNDCFRGCNDEEQIREMLVAQKLISRKYEGLAEVMSMVRAYLGFGCSPASSASIEGGSAYAVVE